MADLQGGIDDALGADRLGQGGGRRLRRCRHDQVDLLTLLTLGEEDALALGVQADRLAAHLPGQVEGRPRQPLAGQLHLRRAGASFGLGFTGLDQTAQSGGLQLVVARQRQAQRLRRLGRGTTASEYLQQDGGAAAGVPAGAARWPGRGPLGRGRGLAHGWPPSWVSCAGLI